MPVQDAVTATVRLQMTARRESHGDVARALGITRQAASLKISGARRWSVDDLDKLAEHYGVTVAQLVNPPLDALASAGILVAQGSVNGRNHTVKRRRLGGAVVLFPKRRLGTWEVAA